jgi:hypothetical protein
LGKLESVVDVSAVFCHSGRSQQSQKSTVARATRSAMPRLQRYVDGSGFYIRGYVPSGGFCVWQTTPEALKYLASLGLAKPGDFVSLLDLNYLLAQSWIRTGGAGPGGTGGPAQIEDELAASLEAWANSGGVGELTAILHGPHGDQRDRCFSTSFLNWLSRLDTAPALQQLSQLADITLSDFEDLADESLGELDDSLHQLLAKRGHTIVLWQLARIIGQVARQQVGDSRCPAAWEAQDLLKRLFVLLDKWSRIVAENKVRHVQRRRSILSAPTIVWEVDLQQVVAVLPEQRLPESTSDLTWRMGDALCRTPRAHHGAGESCWEEARSEPLAPAPMYNITATARGDQGVASELGRWQFELPEEFAPCVLFGSDGTLVELGSSAPQSPGDFLALAPVTRMDSFLRRTGVTPLDRLPVEPVGWHGWQGWRVALAANAAIAPYVVRAEAEEANWALELQDPGEIVWRDGLPVWMGTWPRLFVQPPEAFEGSVVEVGRDGWGRSRNATYLTIGKHVIIRSDGAQRSFVDLSEFRSLAALCGHLTMRCRPVNCCDGRSLVARFTRLPALRLQYVRSTATPSASMSLRIESQTTLRGLMTGSDTILTSDSDRMVELRPACPVESPVVSAKLPEDSGELRVRVPVRRGTLIDETGTFSGWRPLPISDLDLHVGLTSRLRIELDERPVVASGKLIFRLLGGEELLAGEPIRDERLHVFELELHRWRDSFGIDTSGVVQIRLPSGWLEVARLVGGKTPGVSVPPCDHRLPLLAELEAAILRGDEQAGLRLIDECLARMTDRVREDFEIELLALAVARGVLATPAATSRMQAAAEMLLPFEHRPDLPEARVLRRNLSLRTEATQAEADPWSLDRLERMKAEVSACPGEDLVMAECNYHFARSQPREAPGCWQSCAEYACSYRNQFCHDELSRGPVAEYLRRLLDTLQINLDEDQPYMVPDRAAALRSAFKDAAWLDVIVDELTTLGPPQIGPWYIHLLEAGSRQGSRVRLAMRVVPGTDSSDTKQASVAAHLLALAQGGIEVVRIEPNAPAPQYGLLALGPSGDPRHRGVGFHWGERRTTTFDGETHLRPLWVNRWAKRLAEAYQAHNVWFEQNTSPVAISDLFRTAPGCTVHAVSRGQAVDFRKILASLRGQRIVACQLQDPYLLNRHQLDCLTEFLRAIDWPTSAEPVMFRLVTQQAERDSRVVDSLTPTQQKQELSARLRRHQGSATIARHSTTQAQHTAHAIRTL